jgi:hypothetical protein
MGESETIRGSKETKEQWIKKNEKQWEIETMGGSKEMKEQ